MARKILAATDAKAIGEVRLPAEAPYRLDSVTISTTNSAPVAEAGRDRAIALGQTVRLDGGASSDVDGDPLSYSWTLVARPAGSAAVS